MHKRQDLPPPALLPNAEVAVLLVLPNPPPEPNPPVEPVLLPNSPPEAAGVEPKPDGFAPKGELFAEPKPPPEPNPPVVAVLPPPNTDPVVAVLFAPKPVLVLEPKPPPLPNPDEVLLLLLLPKNDMVTKSRVNCSELGDELSRSQAHRLIHDRNE